MRNGRPAVVHRWRNQRERAVGVERCTVGVVKNHRTLYADGRASMSCSGFGDGERTSVFHVPSQAKTVASWYLRLRDPIGHDPMWGLVRVEIAYPQPMQFARS